MHDGEICSAFPALKARDAQIVDGLDARKHLVRIGRKFAQHHRNGRLVEVLPGGSAYAYAYGAHPMLNAGALTEEIEDIRKIIGEQIRDIQKTQVGGWTTELRQTQIRRFLRASLQAHDYQVIEAENGKEDVRACTVQKPDLLILDLGLPDIDGLEVIKLVREWSTVPIIILSLRSDDPDKIEALDRGANDYVTKPFSMGELLARMRVALRQGSGGESEPVITAGEISIDLSKRLVTVSGPPVRLSRKEYDLLRILASHPGKVITHQQLLQEVWGQAYVEETQYLRVYIGQLRQKLEKEPAAPKYLITEPGVGYRLQLG